MRKLTMKNKVITQSMMQLWGLSVDTVYKMLDKLFKTKLLWRGNNASVILQYNYSTHGIQQSGFRFTN